MSLRPIILAEDNEKLRHLYADMLEAVGFSVMRASDGEKAVGLLHKVVNPQLIILDVMMPRLNGIDACIRMRKMQGLRACPILFLTALDDPENVLECLRAGGDDFLMKSAPMAEVLERVQYWARRGASEEDSERRLKAIKTLEAIAQGSKESGALRMAAEIAAEQEALERLSGFLRQRIGVFGDETQLLHRFGYLAGLVESCAPSVAKSEDGFHRFLRSLVFRTDFIDRREINALLENYTRLMNQRQFQEGWNRGRDEASGVGVPAPAATPGDLAEQPGAG